MSVSFKADRKELLTALEDAERGCGNGTIAVLAGVLVECTGDTVSLTGTNAEIAIKATFPAEVKKTGWFVAADAKKLIGAVKTLDDGFVSVSATKESTVVEQDGVTLRLGVLTAEDFPAPRKVVEPTSTFAVTAAEFLGVWKRIKGMYSSDMSRPVLTSVHVATTEHRAVFEATDSYRLAFDWAPAKVKGEASVLIPGETMEVVARYAKNDDQFGLVEFVVDGDSALIEVGRVFITSRLVQGQYPNRTSLIPAKFDGEFDLDAAAAVKAFRRVQKMSKSRRPLRLVVPTSAGSTRIYTLDGKIVDTDQLVATSRVVGGGEFEIGLDPGFSADAIEALGGDVVTVRYINPLRPLLFSNGKEDAGVLQMPIKLS